MHWKISQFPELDHLDAEQRAALLRGVPMWTYANLVLRAVFAGIIAGMASVGILDAAMPSWTVVGGAGVTVFLVGVSVGGLATYVVQLRFMRVAMREEIAKGSVGQRPPFCFECGYDLRGCDEQRCPECGRVTGSVRSCGQTSSASERRE